MEGKRKSGDDRWKQRKMKYEHSSSQCDRVDGTPTEDAQKLTAVTNILLRSCLIPVRNEADTTFYDEKCTSYVEMCVVLGLARRQP